jgi:hypothetical protein
LFTILFCAVGSTAPAATSTLVYEDTDGSLLYGGYANFGQTSTDNRMIDFSHAGYKGGGVPVPFVPVAMTLNPSGAGSDDTARIQSAIDTVSALPLSSSGFRGALLLTAGSYKVSETLHINASGVVIRGEGQDASGSVIEFTATVQDDLFEFSGSSGWTPVAGTETAIADTLVPSGSWSFNVASASGFSVGDDIIVSRTPNQAWIDLLEMGQYGWTTSEYVSNLPRKITAIDGNTITIDAPLTHAIESQYGGGEIYRYTFNGAITQVGIENLRMESSFTSSTDENHGWSAVQFHFVKDAWARQLTAQFFGYSCVDIRDHSLFVTVEDCASLDPKSQVTGGRRYAFRIDNSSFVLFQRCFSNDGRHDFVSQFRTAGPNVFVDGFAPDSNNDSGPHHRYSEGILFDNIKTDEIHVQNREDSGTGHGWVGAQIVLWNSEATSLICDTPEAVLRYPLAGATGVHSAGWTQDSGPATASFADAASAATTVTFPVPGTYVLRYSASQDYAQTSTTYSDFDTLTVTVTNPPDATASVNSVDSIIRVVWPTARPSAMSPTTVTRPLPAHFPTSGLSSAVPTQPSERLARDSDACIRRAHARTGKRARIGQTLFSSV